MDLPRKNEKMSRNRGFITVLRKLDVNNSSGPLSLVITYIMTPYHVYLEVIRFPMFNNVLVSCIDSNILLQIRHLIWYMKCQGPHVIGSIVSVVQGRFPIKARP